jgi:dihydrofolate synthase/folylpolyglutamate synthase
MGMRTGRFTSPHLEDFRERICINGAPISQEALEFTYNDIKAYFDFVDSKSDQPLSYFEGVTALAFAAFAEHPVDVGIFEVGMGGEWDATNVVQPDVAVITPIGLDHQEYLGSDILQIAQTKSGILKEGAFAVFAEQEPEVAKLLMRKAAEKSLNVARAGLDFEVLKRQIAVGGQLLTIRGIKDIYTDLFLPLHGKHQAQNAALALVAVEAFFGEKELDHDAVKEGFASASSPGRLEVVKREPTIILDAAHNPHGARALANAMQEEFNFDQTIGVVGVFKDKDGAGILLELEPVLDSVIITQSNSERALPAENLATLARKIFGAERVYLEPDLKKAIDKATATNPLSDDTVGVLITGSVTTVGQARSLI